MADEPHNGSGGSGNGAEDQQDAGDASWGRHEAAQTLSDTEQTLSDSDQTGSESDQTAADEDQIASDHDQAASDRAYTLGGDSDVHRVTQALRERSTRRREQTARDRVDAAVARDAAAHARDLASLARDKAAALRDRELAERDAATMGAEPAEKLLKRVVADRAAAAEGRARAAADREQAARDREQAGRDRAQARADRDVLLSHLNAAEIEALIGSRTRDAGLRELEVEIDRARRTTGVLVIAYVDVAGPKPIDVPHAHPAGDALLTRAVGLIRAQLRSYDLIVRLGRDEFLCVLSGVTLDKARARFAAVETAFRTGEEDTAISVGFAALGPDDSAADLIGRAGADFPARPGDRP